MLVPSLKEGAPAVGPREAGAGALPGGGESDLTRSLLDPCSELGQVDFARLAQRLAARERQVVALPGYRESAVLVPIRAEAPGHEAAQLLLTVRDGGLSKHAGQVSFPGGKREAADADLAVTAIRETAEEVGLQPSSVEVLGLLDDVPTPTGYIITPVVARLREPATLRPQASEVAEIFFADLPTLRSCHRTDGAREFLGVRYEMHEYPFEGRHIWGATARIIWQLLGLFDGNGR